MKIILMRYPSLCAALVLGGLMFTERHRWERSPV